MHSSSLHKFLKAARFLQSVITLITTTTSRSSSTWNSKKKLRPADLLDSLDLNSTPEHDQLQQSTSSFKQQISTCMSVADILNSDLRTTEKPHLDILRTSTRQASTFTSTYFKTKLKDTPPQPLPIFIFILRLQNRADCTMHCLMHSFNSIKAYICCTHIYASTKNDKVNNIQKRQK